MYHPSGQSLYPQNVPYQQSQPQQATRPFQPQQFGPRFQTPQQQLTPPGSFYQTSRPPLNDQPRPHFQGPANGQQFYQPVNQHTPQPSYQPPIQNYENPPNIPPPQYPPSPVAGFNQPPLPSFTSGSPIQNYNQHPPTQNFHRPPPIQNYNQTPVQNYNQPPPVQNLNQPPLVQNFNQPPPVQNFNHPPIQNFNQPPPTQNYNQPPASYQPANQNCHQPVTSLYQCPSPGFGPPPNSPYQPQVQSPEPLKQPYQSSSDQCFQQQQSSFNAPRPNFNQHIPFRSPGQQRFPFNNQKPRYQQPQHGNNRFQFQPRQQYHNHRPRGPPPNFNNQSMGNGVPKKDKEQLTCDMDDCDFVGHAAAIREHQNLHHRFGLHKKVLYSNNSDAVNNWIKERKKKWPTKETIRTKLEVEDEKNKRGERIADDDFHRFNNKNNKFNNSGPNKRFNNRKRPRTNGEFVEPIEEPFNEKLKRFAGIMDVLEEENKTNDDIKPDALKLLEEYDESSDDEPPEETAIVKESALLDIEMSPVLDGRPCPTSETRDISMEQKEESCSTLEMEGVSLEHKEKVNSTSLVTVDSKTLSSEMKTETSSNVKEECDKTDNERSQKRKKNSNKEFKPIKRTPPLRTPRTEVLEKKGALLEALMGDLMRKERNAITQCICYIRNNMHRFRKTQAA